MVYHSLKPKWQLIVVDTIYNRLSHTLSAPSLKTNPVKIILGSVEEKQLLLNRRKMLYSVMPDYCFHQSYSRAEWLKYRAHKEELQLTQGPGRERPGNQKQSHNSEEVSSQEFFLAHNRYDDGKVSEHSVMKIHLANWCSLFDCKILQ